MELKNDNWHVLYTRPRHEKKIHKEISKKNIKAFLPLIKVVRQWSDRKKTIEVPLFSNYLFVQIPLILFYQVLMIDGAFRFIHYNGKPATISQSEIDRIQLMLLGKPEVTNQIYQLGDIVKVVNSPLKGLEGVLIEQKGKTRLSVRVQALNKSLLLNVRKCDLEIVNRNANG